VVRPCYEPAMRDLFADVSRAIHEAFPDAIYIRVAKGEYPSARFGLALEFRVPYGDAVNRWPDDVWGGVVVSSKPPPT